MVKDNGLEYYESLPNDHIKLPQFKEIFKIKEGESILTIENALLRIDLKLILFNPQTNEFYPRYIHVTSDTKQLYKYFKDGNLYINKNELIWKE